MGPRCGGAKGPAGGALTEGGRVDRQEEGSRTREADGDARGGGDKGPRSGACRRKVIEWTVRGEGQDTGLAGCSTKDRQVGARRAGPLHRGRMGRQVNLSARWPGEGAVRRCWRGRARCGTRACRSGRAHLSSLD